MEEEVFTAYITKYALTRGVLEVEARRATTSDRMIAVKLDGYTSYFHGQDWHESKQEALADVKCEIAAKRKSLGKAVDRLDDLEEKLFDGGIDAIVVSLAAANSGC